MTSTETRLERLGDELQRAWRNDHRRGRFGHRRTRRIAVALALVSVLMIAGVAIASGLLKSNAQEDDGLLGGHLLFKGTHPTCNALTATSFTCQLRSRPTEMTFYDDRGRPLPNAYRGVKTATVDSTRHVDGGCVSMSDDGREWRCYLGEEAVTHGIIDKGFLGSYLPTPPTG